VILGVARNANLGIWNGVVCFGLPYAAILLGATSLDRIGIKVPKVLVGLGDSSYSLYLIHPFILPALGKFWLASHLSERTSPLVLGLIAFSCALFTGHLVYLLIERPTTNRISQAWRDYRSASTLRS